MKRSLSPRPPGIVFDGTTCLIVNPTAGTRRGRMFERAIHTATDKPDIMLTERPGHATELARRAADRGYRIVAAVGGDGTVNEVAQGLIGTNSALGVIATGSGNGFARHLGLPQQPARALAQLGDAGFAKVDVGYINGQPFVCTAGLGFDGHVSRHFAQASRRGFVTYAKTALSRYMSYRPSSVRGRIGDTAFEGSCYVLAFANASQYGNGACIAPHADCSDGLLDVCLIDRLSPLKAVRVGIALMRGTLTQADIAYHIADRVEVSADQPIEYHVDGEYAGKSAEFEVEIHHAKLEVAL